MPSTTPNQPQAESFYMFEADMESNRPPCGVRFENVRNLLSPPRLILRPGEGGFPTLRETPQLTCDP
ncbi:imm11 family protein, partial [Xanthomonas citri]